MAIAGEVAARQMRAVGGASGINVQVAGDRLPVNSHKSEKSMGRGDKRTKKGKTFRHSYGKTRPHDPDKKKAEAAKKRPGRGQAIR